MKKRMISIALVLALLVQILPTYVFAEIDAGDLSPVGTVDAEAEEPGKLVLGELTDRRGENEKHFRMNDGSFIAVDYDVPVHYSIDGGESWEDIDNTLTPSRDDSEIYVAENGNNTRSFAQSLQSGFLFSVGADSHAVRMRLTNASTQNDSNEADSTIPAAPIYDETESSPADQTDGETESSPADQTDGETESSPVDQIDGETESSPADQTDGETESSPANQTDDETESSPADQTDGETESSPADQTDGETESSLADQTDDGEEAATSTDTPIDNPVPSEAENPSLPLQVISTYNSSSVAEISYPDDKRMGSSSEAQNNRGEGGTLSLAEQVTPSKLRAEVLYRDVYEGVDLRYELYSWNVKETILVKEARENCVFSFDLELDELTPVLMDDGSIELRDEADEALYLIPAPYMTDSDGAESDAVSYGLTQSESGVWTLTVVADEDWINDENRTFPVEIDPTVIDKVAWSAQGIGVTYVVSGAPYTTHTHYQSIWLGYTPYSDLYEHQIYVGWDDLPKVPSGSEVINAAFYLGQLDYQAVGPSSIIGGIHAVTSARPSGYSSNYNWICDLYWNNKPALDSTVMDYTTINSATAGHYISWDITPLVKAWYVDGNTQTRAAGIKLYNSSAYGSSYYATAKFHGYGASSGPLFVVTYRDLTGIEPYYTYQSLGADRAGSAYISDYTGALTTVTPLVSYASTVNPFQLSLIYNSSYFEENGAAYNVPQKMGYGFFMGSGTKLNLMQKVEYVDLQYEIDGNATKRYIKYTDGDGTAHYFATDANKQAQEPANSTTYYYDEDGLGLKVTEYTTDFFRMEDDRGNTMYFVRGYLTILIDANGNRYDIFFRHSDGTMESSGYPNYTGDRIDHINQKNAGETNGITVATFQYDTTSEQTPLCRVVDAAGNSYRLNYSGNQLQSVQRKLLDDSDYSSYVAFSYSGSGSLMTQLKDMISTYCINVSYADGRVASYSEAVPASNNSNVTGAGATVTRIPGDRTVYTDWGNDRIASTSDDIITTYLFDYAGRTVNAFTTDTSGAILGASNAIHSGTGDTNKANNRTLRSAGIGMAAMPVVRNGGFEFTGSDTAWTSIIPTGSGNTAQAQNGGLIRTGNRSFKTQVVGAATTPTGCSKSLGSLTAGKTYTVSVYVNTSQATAVNSEGVYLKVSDPWNCTWISEHLNYITETGIDDGWVRLVFPFTAVQNGNHTVYLYNKDMTGPVYFDDFQIDEGDGPSNVNLLDNGGIHSSAVGWYTQANNAASAATVTAIQGNKALSIVGDPQTDRFIWQTVTLNQPADQTYVLSGWAKASAVPDNVNEDNTPREQDTNKQFGLRAILTYSDNTTEYHYVPFNPDVSDWQFVSMAIVPKKAGNNLRVSTIKVICAYEKNANTAYFDNLCLTKELPVYF